jgi:hypothetical protein
MKLTRAGVVDHFGKVGVRGVDKFTILKDGSYLAGTVTKSLLVIAPPLALYSAPEVARVYNINQFLKILRSLHSASGDVFIEVDTKGMFMKLETTRLSYTYILSAADAFANDDINEDTTKKMISTLTFSCKYLLTNSHMKNILQVMGILEAEGVVFKKDAKGFTINVGSKSMHSAAIKVEGAPLMADSIAFMTQDIQDVVKILATQPDVYLEVEDKGQIIRFTTKDGFQYYVQSAETGV